MKVLEERLVYLFTLFCKDLLCSCFHFGSRTFICMFNTFVSHPPSPVAFSFGVCVRVIYFFITTPSVLLHSTCMLDFLWMTKSSSRFMLILSAIYGKTQISSLSCTINVRWPSGSIFAVLGHLSKLEMISLNYLAMSVYLHGEVQWTYHFELSGMFVIPSFVCLLKVVLLLFWRFLVSDGFHFNILWISGRQILIKNVILMSVRVTSDYDPVLSYFRTINTFQWVSRTFHVAFVAFSNLCSIAIPGQIPVHPEWVVCAIWINGSELLDPACFDFESDISSRWKRAMTAKTVTENIWMDVLVTVCFIELNWESRF